MQHLVVWQPNRQQVVAAVRSGIGSRLLACRGRWPFGRPPGVTRPPCLQCRQGWLESAWSRAGMIHSGAFTAQRLALASCALPAPLPSTLPCELESVLPPRCSASCPPTRDRMVWRSPCAKSLESDVKTTSGATLCRATQALDRRENHQLAQPLPPARQGLGVPEPQRLD